MSIEISRLDDDTDWNELVERSPQATPFHRSEALDVFADHSDTELYRFCGYKGEEPVGIFPIFELSRGPVRTALSPPPDLRINYLGPALLNHEHLKQRKAEKRHRRFIEGIDEELERRFDPQYIHVRTGPEYDDPRPFIWNDFEVTLAHTYEVDITPDPDELIMTFSGDIRRNVRNAEDIDHEFRVADENDLDRIIEMVRDRYAEHDVRFGISESFVRDLYRALPDGTMRAYTCRSGGRCLGGDLTLEDDAKLLHWQGAADHDHELAVEDLVSWKLIRRARERGIERYDLCGADSPRLCEYKAKFDPRVRTYYSFERGNVAIHGLKKLYTRIR